MSSMPPSPSFSFSTSPAIWLEPERATAFVAVARVTEDRWVACKVLDSIDFGLEEGGELVFEPRSAMRYGPRTMPSRSTTSPAVRIATTTRRSNTASKAISPFRSFIRTARSSAPCARSTPSQLWSTTRRP